MSGEDIFRMEQGGGHTERLAECERITDGLQKEIDGVKADMKSHDKEAKPFREKVDALYVRVVGIEGKGGIDSSLDEIKKSLEKSSENFQKLIISNIGAVIVALLAIGAFWALTNHRLEVLEKYCNTQLYSTHNEKSPDS